jgi:hypothetical protein
LAGVRTQRIVVWLMLLVVGRARAAEPIPAALAARLAADVAAGRPIVVETHVALCERTIIECGSRALGDGDSLATNLYWASSGGLRGWFERRGSGWERVAILRGHRPEVLETRIYRRREPLGELVVVAHAWRGRAIGAALDAWVADLTDGRPRRYPLGEGRVVEGGGRAAVVAYVGHNGWMDRPEAPFPAPAAGTAAQGAIAIACRSREWLVGDRARGALIAAHGEARRVPLVMTADLLFATAAALDGALLALARGGDLGAVREGAADGYARAEGKPTARVRSLFTNSSDRRWR